MRRTIEGAGLLGAVLLLLGLGRTVGVMLGFGDVGLVWWLAFLVGFYLLSVAIAYTSARLPALIETALADAEPSPAQAFEGPVDAEDCQRWQRVVASMSPAAGRLDASLPSADDSPTVEQVVPRVVECRRVRRARRVPATGRVGSPAGVRLVVPEVLGYGAGMTGRLFTPDDLAPGHAAYRAQVVENMRRLIDGPCGRQVLAVLLALAVRDPEAEMTKAAIVERTDYGEPTVRKALDRAALGELVNVERRRGPGRHRYYRLTPAGREFAERLAARRVPA